MRLTTKGRYAVTAMLDLTINASKGPVTLSDISKRQDISLSYLEQLFFQAAQAGTGQQCAWSWRWIPLGPERE